MAINFDRVPRYIRDEIEKEDDDIERGRRGRRARQVQEWLNYHGFRVGIDEDFGPATEESVKAFQLREGLDAHGRIDARTWTALVAPVRTALDAPWDPGDTLTLPQAVRRVARRHLDQRPFEIGRANEGPWVRLYCEGNHGAHWAWCAGFVSLVVQQACFYLDRPAPFRGSVSCDVLAAQAKEAGRFVSGRDVAGGDVPWSRFEGCCIFLRRRTDTDWTHTGFALDAHGTGEARVFETIEGNTNDEGSREGYEACARRRTAAAGSYDFISLS